MDPLITCTKCRKKARYTVICGVSALNIALNTPNDYLESCLVVIEILVYLIVRFVALGISQMSVDAHGRSRVLVT